LNIFQGLRPDLPHSAHPKLLDLMQRCWETVPDRRPSFSEITVELQKLLQESQVDFLTLLFLVDRYRRRMSNSMIDLSGNYGSGQWELTISVCNNLTPVLMICLLFFQHSCVKKEKHSYIEVLLYNLGKRILGLSVTTLKKQRARSFFTCEISKLFSIKTCILSYKDQSRLKFVVIMMTLYLFLKVFILFSKI
jgi:hypothetical protein